eukprot:CCRYP_020308-RA/>CCRYP_020308-RA protein AED:0.33 eAED:0.33 QI:0/0/0/1/0/0/3/0/300
MGLKSLKVYAIDKATGTTFWCDAIEKEMTNVRVAFDILTDGAAPPPDHQFKCCHMIFDVKIEDFQCKAQLVEGGHATKAPAMSRETVCIALLLAALNVIDVWAADVLGMSLSAPGRVHARYGLQVVPADPDQWLKEQTDRKGIRYYSYILCCVDNLLVVHNNPKHIMDKINGFLLLKPDSVGPPKMYLGAKLRKKTFEARRTEFCAIKHGIENLRGIRYKLRTMGIPLKSASYVYGNNMSVVTNTSKPESTLKKKLNSICYHAVREAVAMGEALVAHIPTKKNLADLFTKVLYGQTRQFL